MDQPSPAAPSGEPPKPPARRPRWRPVAWTLGVLALLAALTGGIVGGLYWAAGTPGGTTWLLARLALAGVQVDVQGLQGALLGDLQAQQITVTVGRTRVVVDRPAWRALSVQRSASPRTWARVQVQSLQADRVTITVAPGADDGQPATLPASLRLPIELFIADLRAAEVHVPGLPEHPLREVRTRLHFGHDHGRSHRLDDVSLRLDPMRVTGHLRIGADAPLPLDVQLQATQGDTSQAAVALPAWAQALRADWQAQVQASGPLARFNTQARLRAQGQSLDATAQVAPLERWPLPQLEARTQALDLSAVLQKAPLTALNGLLRIAPETDGRAPTLTITADFDNTRPGRWDQQQLPLRKLGATARWRTDQASDVSLPRFEVQLADERSAAGTLQGTAQWKSGEFQVAAQLDRVRPSGLDGRLAAMTLSGPLTLTGQMQPRRADGRAAPPRFTALAELSGRLVEPAQPVQLRLDATGSEERIELRELRASAGAAQALLTGTAERSPAGAPQAGWQLQARAALDAFDPKPWFPIGPRGGWQSGAYRFNLRGDGAAHLPDSALSTGPDDKRQPIERLAGVKGEVQVHLANSVLANVPVSGDLSWQHDAPAEPMHTHAELDVGGNQIRLDGQVATDARGAQDRWTLDARAPALARLAPLLRAVLPKDNAHLAANLAGEIDASAQASGRWPDMSTQGRVSLGDVRAGDWAVGQAEARWQVSSALDAPLDLQVQVGQAAWAGRQISNTLLELKGSGQDHELSLNVELRAAPPVWVESLQGRAAVALPASAPVAGANVATTNTATNTATSTATTTATTSPARAPVRTLATASARGSLSGNPLQPVDRKTKARPWSWKGMLRQFELRTTQAGATPLLITRDIGLEVQGGPPLRATVTAGRADILGAGLRWNRIDWAAGHGLVTQQLDMQAELEPVAVAPLLRRVQPNFGWGGDLQIAGKVVVRQTDRFTADIVLERRQGDLNVTDETGTQALGLSDLRIGLDARDGTWNFTAGLAGEHLGVLGGALVVRTSPTLAWPAADAPVEGVLEAQVAHLGSWGAWVPAGWRLDGKLNISAALGGRFNAPEYTGRVLGSGLGVRNMVEGVSLTDGQVDISLRGDTAQINTFTARGGAGTVRLEGGATLDDTWRARIKLVADKFQLLGRVDLRVVATGEGTVAIDGDNVKSEGRFTVDEGLIDFTRLSSPSLGDDVVVTGRGTDPREAPPTAPAQAGGNRISLDLLVGLGERLQMRGLGIDTFLRGELRVSRPSGKWALAGTVRAVDGTFENYGQKLVIDRGVINFVGAPSDMRLDIEATRPNLDVRVGVAVTGPLQNLRVKLFSEPEMSNNEKLSWLLLGRASDGLGKTDTALVQRAAFALLAGDGGGGPGAITKAFGIDDLGLRQTEGDTRETVVSVGKQLSKRVYIAYEQNLATSSGSFQVTYRIAQRFVMRLQSGLDRSVDLIGTWRWE